MSKIMQALKAAKALLSTIKLSQEPLTNGSLIKYEGDAIKKGTTVYLMDSNDDWSVLADGEYATKAGGKFTITDGIVTAADEADIETDNDKADEKKPKKQAQAKEKTGDDDTDNGDQGEDDPDNFDDFDDEFEDEMSAEAKKPYGNVEYADKGYQKDKRHRYPIDTAE